MHMLKYEHISRKLFFKFLFVSTIGVCAFMVPFHYQGSINTMVGVFTDLIKQFLSPCMDEVIVGLVAFSAIGSVLDFVLTQSGKKLKGRLHSVLHTSTGYLLTKVFAFAVVLLCYLGIGPKCITSPEVGGTMINLGATLVALAIALSYLLPFLTDGGLMEFIGEITKPIVRPLFKVPSDASIDLIASWLGASNAAVILSAEKYKKGYYSKREAAIVMTNFSLVSIPFCLVIATTTRTQQHFPAMYGLLAALGLLLALITPRIYPLNRLSDEYAQTRPVAKKPKSEEHILRRATIVSCCEAENFKAGGVLTSGTNVMLTICINLLPIVIGWGVLGLLIIEYTPIFEWISLPMGWYLDLLGVKSAYVVAPATLVGFVDMFIPALLVTAVASAKTRFIITTLSLIQIIYITEVGSVVIQTKLGIDFKRLFLIFIERTLISIPIIVFVSNWIY